jgi:hypothetical protein
MSYANPLHWPRILNRDRTWTWEPAGRTVSGGRSLSNIRQAASVDGGGLWTASLSDVRLTRPDHVRAWRALAAGLDGGATPFVMEMREPKLQPFLTVDGERVTTQGEATHGDGATFSDGSSYLSDVIRCELLSAADLRATTLELVLENATGVRGGEHLSIQHATFSHRLYRVAGVTKADARDHRVAAVTIGSAGSPAVASFTAAGHGLAAGQAVYFRTSSAGALPSGLTALTLYYVDADSLTANIFRVAATPGGAPIAYTGAGTGAHRLVTGGLPTVTIRPPLREATAAGTRVEFDYPKCMMKLGTPNAMSLALELRRFGRPGLTLEEDLG